MAKTTTFSVYQTDTNDGTAECLYWGITEREAQAEADRINRNLAARGIPSWVSTAYVTLANPLHDYTSHHHPPMTRQQQLMALAEQLQELTTEEEREDYPFLDHLQDLINDLEMEEGE